MSRKSDQLVTRHGSELLNSGIPYRDAVAAGVYSLSKPDEICELLNWEYDHEIGFGNCIVFTYRDRRGNETGYHRLKPDNPRRRDGKSVKYEAPFDEPPRVYFPPNTRKALDDPTKPILITEGEKKTLCADFKGFPCVGIPGVWSWQKKRDKGNDGRGKGPRVLIDDLGEITWQQRIVYIVFDSDAATNDKVQWAEWHLASVLKGKGADVRIVRLPEGKPKGDDGEREKVGLDDYLVQHSPAALKRLLKKAAPAERPVPEPYTVSNDSLVWNKHNNDGVVPISLSNFSAKIIEDVQVDDGAEVRRTFRIESLLFGQTVVFDVQAEGFASLSWVTEQLGASAIVFPGNKDRARCAIQCLSGNVPLRRIFAHTGWRQIDGEWVFLHAGGGICRKCRVLNTEVRPPDTLTDLVLPEPPSSKRELQQAVRASLRLLELTPDHIAFTVLSAIYRAPLGPVDCSLHLAGPTGVGKSELAALAQQHYGAGFDARHLPANWSSTANALEGIAFAAKDVLLVVDDFAPGGTPYDVQKMHREADRLLRAQGNRAGRQRMNADSTLRSTKFPRGLIVTTGEDIPRGQSLRARMLILELGPDDLRWDHLSKSQQEAADGLYAQAMSAYVHWLSNDYDKVIRNIPNKVAKLRDKSSSSPSHRRTPMTVGQLGVGLRYFLDFARDIGAIDDKRAKRLWKRGWEALAVAAQEQARHVSASEPTQRFVELLTAAITSGRAHLAGSRGGPPLWATACGWRLHVVGSGQHEREEWRPQGDCIGWIDGNDLYLEPESSFAAAQRFTQGGSGENLCISARTLRKRLSEKGLLLSRDTARETLTVRRVLASVTRDVLHMRANLFVSEPDISDSKKTKKNSKKTRKSSKKTKKNNKKKNNKKKNGKGGREKGWKKKPTIR